MQVLFGVELPSNAEYVALVLFILLVVFSSQVMWTIIQASLAIPAVLMILSPASLNVLVQYFDVESDKFHEHLIMACGITLLCSALTAYLTERGSSHVKNSMAFSRVLGFGTAAMVFIQSAIVHLHTELTLMTCIICILIFGELMHIVKCPVPAYVPGSAKVPHLMVSATLGFLFGAFLFAFPDFYLSYTYVYTKTLLVDVVYFLSVSHAVPVLTLKSARLNVDSSLDIVHLFYTRVFGALTGGISLACACAVYFNEDTQNSVIITTLVTHSCYLWIAIYHHMNDDDYHTIGHTIDIALHAILVIDLLLGVFATDSVKME